MYGLSLILQADSQNICALWQYGVTTVCDCCNIFTQCSTCNMQGIRIFVILVYKFFLGLFLLIFLFGSCGVLLRKVSKVHLVELIRKNSIKVGIISQTFKCHLKFKNKIQFLHYISANKAH